MGSFLKFIFVAPQKHLASRISLAMEFTPSSQLSKVNLKKR